MNSEEPSLAALGGQATLASSRMGLCVLISTPLLDTSQGYITGTQEILAKEKETAKMSGVGSPYPIFLKLSFESLV